MLPLCSSAGDGKINRIPSQPLWASLGIEKTDKLETCIGKWLRVCALGDFPGGAVVKNPPANAGDTGSSPDAGRSHTSWSN